MDGLCIANPGFDPGTFGSDALPLRRSSLLWSGSRWYRNTRARTQTYLLCFTSFGCLVAWPPCCLAAWTPGCLVALPNVCWRSGPTRQVAEKGKVAGQECPPRMLGYTPVTWCEYQHSNHATRPPHYFIGYIATIELRLLPHVLNSIQAMWHEQHLYMAAKKP